MVLNSWLNLFSSTITSLACVIWFHFYLKYSDYFPGRHIKIRNAADFLPALAVGGFGVFLMPIMVVPFLGTEICELFSFKYRLDVPMTLLSFFIFYPMSFLIYWTFVFKRSQRKRL